ITNIHEGGDDSVLSTQDIVNGCLGDSNTFLKNGKLEQVVAIIKSCSSNALSDLKVTVKDLFGGSEMLMEEEEIVKLMEEEEMADLELHVCGNVIDQEDLYKKKPVRIILSPADIFQLVKIRKQSDIHEGGDDSVLSTQDIVNGCLGDSNTFLKNGKLEQVVAIIKSCSSNALSDLKVTVKDLFGGSEMLMEEEEIVKLMEEEEMADLELHVCGNVIDQEDLYSLMK
nr:hypothetical protein [Tanacetum cinerariifolium]